VRRGVAAVTVDRQAGRYACQASRPSNGCLCQRSHSAIASSSAVMSSMLLLRLQAGCVRAICCPYPAARDGGYPPEGLPMGDYCRRVWLFTPSGAYLWADDTSTGSDFPLAGFRAKAD